MNTSVNRDKLHIGKSFEAETKEDLLESVLDFTEKYRFPHHLFGK